MVDKSIRFRTEMIEAILDGKKTQTRRPIKGANPEWEYSLFFDRATSTIRWDGGEISYLKPGDELWVKETWYRGTTEQPGGIHYKAGSTKEDLAMFGEMGLKSRPSTYMKKADSRITLRIKAVHVERVQEISNEDLKAEGTTYDRFVRLWNKIYSDVDLGWEKNPWVWVLRFGVAERKRGNQ